MTAQNTPEHLDAAGSSLWHTMTGAYELDVWECVVLEAACRQADDVARLEAVLRDGVIVEGSNGQPRLAQAVTEARQGRLALAKLLDAMRLPAEDEAPRSGASARAQRAANARWGRVRERRERAADGAA